LDELKGRWRGDGVLVWRPSDLGSSVLQVGSNNSSILSVRVALNQVFSKIELPNLVTQDSEVFGLDLFRRVQELQSKYNIIADGKIGNETYLLLNELLFPDRTLTLAPRLTN